MQREGTGKDRKGPKGMGQQRSVAGDGIGWPAVCMGGDRARLSFPSQAPREHRLLSSQAKYRIRGPQHTDREERWKIDFMYVCIMVVIIPEELKNHRGHFTYSSLEQERQQHSIFPFKNLLQKGKNKSVDGRQAVLCNIACMYMSTIVIIKLLNY